MHNKFMKFGKNWVDDESITEEEVMEYVSKLEPAEVMNFYEKLEYDKAQADIANAELIAKINANKSS